MTLVFLNCIIYQFTTSSHPGDVLLAPRDLSDIAAISMDGTSVYYVRKGAFLARGPRVTVNIGRIYGMVTYCNDYNTIFQNL
jgi:uncharacterized protein (AIM24 family)